MVVVAVAIVATGRGGTPRAIGLRTSRCHRGTRVRHHVRSCDRGRNPYCAVQVVLVGDHYRSSAALRETTGRPAQARAGRPRRARRRRAAADSPGHELRLTYATASEDLLGVDSNWIQRTPAIAHALSTAMFDRAPALSLML